MTTVDRDRLAGHPGGPLADEEPHAIGDVRGFAEAPHGDPLDKLPLARLAVAGPLPLGRRVGQDEAGRYAVDRDAERPELVRHLPGEPDLAGLGAGVRLDPGQAHGAPGARGDVDDPAPAAFLHARDDRTGAQERAGQVRIDDRVPVLVGHLLQRVTNLAGHSPGVVDQDVNGAGAGEELPHRVAVGQVGGVLVDPMDGRSLTGQRLGDRGADAVRGACDDRRFARQAPRHLTKYQFSGLMLSVGLCGRTPLRLLVISLRVKAPSGWYWTGNC